ncbi:nonribosomal peptide synthetase [Solibacillus silvestris]
MKWSKTKSTLEGFICEKLQGRIKIYATVYRKFHDGPSRVWITFDKKEIISASDVTYQTRHEETYRKIKEEENLRGIPFNPNWDEMFYSLERQALVKASDKSEEMMINQNIFSSYHFYAPFMEYSSLSIEEALTSENIMIQAFAMFDRRLGKRRLENLILTSKNTHPLILRFYKIRCDVEGIAVTENPPPKM